MGAGLRALWALLLLVDSSLALAQQSERFGPYELHYSVVNTTFLAPEVAAAYGIVRGDRYGILTLAVTEHAGEGSANRPMELAGKTWDLIQNQPLQFQEIREGEAVYYIAPFSFINEEWRFFELHFRPQGAGQTYSYTFKHQLYTDE